METKIVKLKRLLKEATDKHEQVISYYFKLVLDRFNPSVITDEGFDKLLLEFMKERVAYANKFIGKKKNKVFEEEIYCLSLLSLTFLNGKFNPVIVDNKVSLNEQS
jgi:hypothetical protein